MKRPEIGALFRVAAERDGEPHPFAGMLFTYLGHVKDPEDTDDVVGILHWTPDDLAGALAEANQQQVCPACGGCGTDGHDPNPETEEPDPCATCGGAGNLPGKDWPVTDLEVEGLATFEMALELQPVDVRETVERTCPVCTAPATGVRARGDALLFQHGEAAAHGSLFEIPEVAR